MAGIVTLNEGWMGGWGISGEGSGGCVQSKQ